MSGASSDSAEFRTPQLQGRVEAVRIWVDSAESRWQPEEMARTEAAIAEAERWMARQARDWGVPLEFRPPGGRDLYARLPSMPGGHGAGPEMSISDWVDLITPHVGWVSPGAFLTDRQIEGGVDHAHILLLIHREGRSYALSNEYAGDSSDAMPVAACYLKTEAIQAWAGTIAHETLHLYGAWDLYPDKERHREQSDHAARLFAGDIMRTGGDIDRLHVSDLTAWRLGWRHSGPAWFEFFSPALSREHLILESMERPPATFRSMRESPEAGGGGSPSRLESLPDLWPLLRWILRESGRVVRRWSDFPRLVGWTRWSPYQGAECVTLGRPPQVRDPGPVSGLDVPASGPASTEPIKGRPRRRVLRRKAARTARTGPEAPREPLVIDRLMGLDPLADATAKAFESLMESILKRHSLAEATAIANAADPMPPSGLVGGHANPSYRHLRLELATIRRIIQKQGAGGVVEEDRLRRAVEEWGRFVQRERAGGGGDARLQANEAFRRSVLILDSIQRRDTTELQLVVAKFHELRRQLGI